MRIIRKLLLSFVLIVLNVGLAFAHDHNHVMPQTAPLPGQSVYNLENSWTNQDGALVQLSQLRGQPVVLAMMYSACKEMCPLTIEHMRQIEAMVDSRALGKVHYILVSFDSERDTPARLKEFGTGRGMDFQRWSLLHGSPEAVRDLAAVLGINYKKLPNGDFDHSYAITLLDGVGQVAIQQIGLKPEPKQFADRIASLYLDQR
jgi:protein SCO1/2